MIHFVWNHCEEYIFIDKSASRQHFLQDAQKHPWVFTIIITFSITSVPCTECFPCVSSVFHQKKNWFPHIDASVIECGDRQYFSFATVFFFKMWCSCISLTGISITPNHVGWTLRFLSLFPPLQSPCSSPDRADLNLSCIFPPVPPLPSALSWPTGHCHSFLTCSRPIHFI